MEQPRMWRIAWKEGAATSPDLIGRAAYLARQSLLLIAKKRREKN